ncbi:Phytanoyl-CoA dioxygenase (PhyH) [Seminavis robusta]|uniref:Phytanoyl-CoA dioxygenase (PhyH) n=1 Tax=Seminavis robusta TaxID=568900 RepID=A0A9N8D956_9STRA|nr:Phytanoyl-CoA dioxygenase (PhyH) [Seminavis robusta]|eukprot:Sro43_g026350.1 Phytanoyl-CoA dioxygenase (PhyH) (377) ;mRNA; r:129589-130719
MFCVVLGVVPADPELGERIRRQVVTTTVEDGAAIAWRPSHSLAPDPDKDGVMTLLLTAMSEEPATPESIVAAAEKVVSSSAVVVELWASAPAPLRLKPLEGYQEKITVATPHNHEEPPFALAMREWGLVLQPHILDAEGIAAFRLVVDQAIANIETALATQQPQLAVGQDAFCFQEIASRNKERFDLRLQEPSKVALVKEHIISGNNPQIVSNLKTAMGIHKDAVFLEEVDFDLSVVYSRPGACAQGWHADGDHVKGALDAGWEETGWKHALADPYAICLFLPLIDLDETVGYTQFWPASHQHRALAGFGPAAHVTGSVWNGDGKAGDGIFYDYRLLHQGMPNTSANTLRPVIQIIFKKKWYVEKANYGTKSLYSS